MLAQLVVGKFSDHLPLYRLEDIFGAEGRHGIAAFHALPLGPADGRIARAAVRLDGPAVRALLACDSHRTIHPFPCSIRTLGHTRTGRFWVYCGDPDNPYSVYDYTPSRKRDGPAKFLAEYRSYLQADAFAGYDGIYAAGTVKQVLWLKAMRRRKFFEAKETKPRRGRDEALAWIARLYRDRRTRRKTRRTTSGGSLRQERTLPLLAQFREWLSVVDGSRLAQEPVWPSRAVRAAALGRLCTFL